MEVGCETCTEEAGRVGILNSTICRLSAHLFKAKAVRKSIHVILTRITYRIKNILIGGSVASGGSNCLNTDL